MANRDTGREEVGSRANQDNHPETCSDLDTTETAGFFIAEATLKNSGHSQLWS